MRVVAARFRDRDHASRALEKLQHRLEAEVEAEIAPLAAAGEPSASYALLAGHFDDELLPEVQEVVTESGGEIVADVDERWTMPNSGGHKH